MNKKLMAVAVAGALAAPGLALAQSSVTISGFIKASVNEISVSGATPYTVGAGAGTSPRIGNTSEFRFIDDGPSRIRFTMREDLGGGLYGLGQLEIRPTVNGSSGFGNTAGFGSTAGNSWVGIESSSLGSLRFGAIDRHYILSANTALGGALPNFAADPLTGYAYILPTSPGQTSGAPISAPPGAPSATVGVASQLSIGSATRTRNQIGYDSPVIADAWRFNAGFGTRDSSGQGFNMANSVIPAGLAGAGGHVRTARVWFAGVNYDSGPITAGISYYDTRESQVTVAVTAVPGSYTGVVDTKQLRAMAAYTFPMGIRVGITYDNFKAYNPLSTTTIVAGVLTPTGVAGDVGKRTAWNIPISYTTGPHGVQFLYARAGDDKIAGANTGASFWSLGYAYNFSKRTSIGAAYARLTNKSAATYSAADTTGVANAYSTANSELYTGEDSNSWGIAVRHIF